MKKLLLILTGLCLLIIPSIAQDDVIFISELQGAPTHPDFPDSPFEGEIVTVEGLVIGDFQDGLDGVNGDINGFFIQEELFDMDDNSQTSEGLYVFERGGTLANVENGDLVRITGEIDEIRGQTRLEAFEITIISEDNSLPEPLQIAFPVTDRADLEFAENMLVTVIGENEPFTVNDTYDLGRYGTLQLIADGRAYQYTQLNRPNGRDAFDSYRQEVGLRVILIDDGRTNENAVPLPIYNEAFFSAENTVRSGHQIESVTGILEFRFDEWRIQPTQAIDIITSTNARPIDNPDVGGSLRVVGFNLLNYFNGDGQGAGFPTPRGADSYDEFLRQRAKTLQALIQLDADIIGLVELENDYRDGEFSAVQDLVTGLNDFGEATSCGANWAYVDVSQPPIELNTLGTDAVAVGFMYCSATVSIAPDTVPAILRDEMLTDLGLFELAPVFNGVDTSRIPLAVTFRESATDEDVTVVVNHLKAKGGSGEGANRDIGDGVASWNDRRRDAVTALDAWLATNPTGSDDPDILLVGDFNAYAMEDPIQDLIALGYTNLSDTVAHSYGFPLSLGQAPETQGWGTLDYAFASESLQAQVTGAIEWHINSDEPIYIDYNLEFKPEEIIGTLYLPDPYRASDHDPIVVGLNLGSD